MGYSLAISVRVHIGYLLAIFIPSQAVDKSTFLNLLPHRYESIFLFNCLIFTIIFFYFSSLSFIMHRYSTHPRSLTQLLVWKYLGGDVISSNL